MSIGTPENWWKPIHKQEKLWMFVVLAWCGILLIMMPYGHSRDHNISQVTYKTTPAQFEQMMNKFVSKYQTGKQIDVVDDPKITKMVPLVDARNVPATTIGGGTDKAADVFLYASGWKFSPALILKKGKKYRIHMSSKYYQHGFSLLPMNLNYQVLPYHDYVITITPKTASSEQGFRVVCNEYCGSPSSTDGHHVMAGRIIVKE